MVGYVLVCQGLGLYCRKEAKNNCSFGGFLNPDELVHNQPMAILLQECIVEFAKLNNLLITFSYSGGTMENLHYIQRSDPDYPEVFEQLFDPPSGIYAQGNLATLSDGPRLSVVGTRAVSAYGRDVTSRLVREVAEAGVAIVSGLALGVDALAHRAALEANGCTIAVLAAGLDRIHPRNHTALAQQILLNGGCIISEYGLGEPAMKHQFIERNRMVAALGDALLITEAALKSGTMHTVRFALDMGKTVMAVPGNINSTTSVGTNNLLKDGAIAVTSASDILAALGISTSKQQHLPVGDSPEESSLIQLVAQGVSDINELQVRSDLSAATFNQTLTMLELTGKIRGLGGGQWGLR